MRDLFKDDTFLGRWLNGQLSEKESEAFKNTETYADYQRIVDAVDSLEAPAFDKREQWEKVKEATEEKIAGTKVFSLRRYWWVATAAVVLVLIGIGLTLLTKDSSTQLVAPLAEKKTFVLPMGSNVQLNAASKLSFKEKSWENERTVTLEGEAFFEVVEGSKFTVHTSQGSVEVLGTSFNVVSRKNTFEVRCFSGQVNVTTPGGVQKALEKGDQVKILSGKVVEERKLLNKSTPDWINGASFFENATFEEVIEELERQYDVKVMLDTPLKSKPFRGGFQHDNLSEALNNICEAMGANYRIENGKEILIMEE